MELSTTGVLVSIGVFTAVSHILCVLLCYIRVDHIYFIVLFLEDLYSVNLNMLVEYSTVFFFG